jgi:hypothetical protein
MTFDSQFTAAFVLRKMFAVYVGGRCRVPAVRMKVKGASRNTGKECLFGLSDPRDEVGF